MDTSKYKETLLTFQSLYERLYNELKAHVDRVGYPNNKENELLRGALRRTIIERSVPKASASLDLMLTLLGYTPEHAFSVEYKRCAEQLGDRQLTIATLSKEALQMYLDLQECRERLAKNESIEVFANGFNENTVAVNGILNFKKESLLLLEDAHLRDALLEKLCDEPALVLAIDSARNEKSAFKQSICDAVKNIINTLPDKSLATIANQIEMPVSTLKTVIYSPTSERVSTEYCQLVLQRLQALQKTTSEPTKTTTPVIAPPPSNGKRTDAVLPPSMPEDVAHSAMSILQSALRMLETAGKTYVFPHELQVKGVNLSRSLKRIALQGAREENVMEGRPLSQNALESLSGKS